MHFRLSLIGLALLVLSVPLESGACSGVKTSSGFVFLIADKLENNFYDPSRLNWPKLYNGALWGLAKNLKNYEIDFIPEKIKNDVSKQDARDLFKKEFEKAETSIKNKNGLPEYILEFSAADALLETVGDSHCYFMDPKIYREYVNHNTLKPSYSGIGIRMKKLEDGYYYISEIFPEGPAAKSGLKKFDRIMEINSNSIPDSLEKIREQVRGAKGTEVELTITRKGEKNKVKIKREAIIYPFASKEVLKRENFVAGYVLLYSFIWGIELDILDILQQAKANNAGGLILDLRGNPGGAIIGLHDVLKVFLPKGSEAFSSKSRSENKTYEISSNPVTELPLVILIDDNSFSASEVCAAVIQEQGRGKIIGTKSSGKVNMGITHKLPLDCAAMITVAQLITAKGKVLEGIGLVPDIELILTKEDIVTAKDVQLEKAIEVLREEAKKNR